MSQSTQLPNIAAIYVRVSTIAQEENSSLATQEQRCREYAASQGWSVTEVFKEVHTGAELFERPQLARLRDLVRAKQCTVVLAHALDRVSRSQAHLGFLLSEWDHFGASLVLVTEELFDTPEGRLLQSVRGFVAEMERLKIRERSQRGVRARVDSGKPIPGQKAPYGYAWRDATRSGYVFNPDEQPIVRRIFDSILGGKTLRATAQALTLDQVPTPTGRAKRWEVSTLHTILKNPVYTGRPVAYRTRVERVSGRSSIRYRPSSEWVDLGDDVAPPIVTIQEFRAIQAQLARNRAAAPRHNANPEATLLRCGIGRCGYCGYPLQVTRRKGKPHMYRCHPVGRERHDCPSFGIMAHILDPIVWKAVEEVLLRPEIIAIEVEKRKGSDPFAADLESLQRRQQAIFDQQVRLAKAVATIDDSQASEPLLAELKQLSIQATTLREDQSRLLVQESAHQAGTQALDNIMHWCERVAKNLPTLTYQEKRVVMEALGLQVHVFRADHEPRWEITMAPLPIDAADTSPFVFNTATPSSTATTVLTPAGQTLEMATNGAAITLARLDELIDTVKPGKPEALIMSRRTRRQLKNLRRTTGPILETTVAQFGEQVETYEGIPIIVDDFVPDTEVQGSSGAVCSSVYALRFGMNVGLMGLEHGGITIETVGELETKDATRHRLKWYTGLALMSELGVARLKGITAN
jgi:site-specific DNA recombinase